MLKSKNVKRVLEKRHNLDTEGEEEDGFGSWLRSERGVEQMKLFVIGNFIVTFMVMSWPHILQVFEVIGSVLRGE